MHLCEGLSRNGNQESAGQGARESAARRSRCPDRGLDAHRTGAPQRTDECSGAPAAERPLTHAVLVPHTDPASYTHLGSLGVARVTGRSGAQCSRWWVSTSL